MGGEKMKKKNWKGFVEPKKKKKKKNKKKKKKKK